MPLPTKWTIKQYDNSDFCWIYQGSVQVCSVYGPHSKARADVIIAAFNKALSVYEASRDKTFDAPEGVQQ